VIGLAGCPILRALCEGWVAGRSHPRPRIFTPCDYEMKCTDRATSAFLRLNIRPQNRVHAREMALAPFPKPLEYVCVDA